MNDEKTAADYKVSGQSRVQDSRQQDSRYSYRLGQSQRPRLRSLFGRPSERRSRFPQVPPHLRGCSRT